MPPSSSVSAGSRARMNGFTASSAEPMPTPSRTTRIARALKGRSAPATGAELLELLARGLLRSEMERGPERSERGSLAAREIEPRDHQEENGGDPEHALTARSARHDSVG